MFTVSRSTSASHSPATFADGPGADSAPGAKPLGLLNWLLIGLLGSWLFAPSAFADPDLPGAAENIETIPAGSLIIPMDTVYQLVSDAQPENFNNAAYGLVNKLLQNNIPVKWAIRYDKAKVHGTYVGANDATTLVDATKDFVALGVEVGDLVTNISKNPMRRARVTSVAATTLGLAAIDAIEFDNNNQYVIDGHDFTVNAARVRPSAVAADDVTFAGGPFIVSSEIDFVLAKAKEIILGIDDGLPPALPQFNATAAQSAVRVYETTADADIDIRYNLTHKPFAAISDVNTRIHASILIEAGIPGATGGTGDNQWVNCTPLPGEPGFNPNTCNWNQVNPANLSSIECSTIHLEPHRATELQGQTPAQLVQFVEDFLTGGGNMLAQCHSVEYFENDDVGGPIAGPGNFMTSRGIDDNNTAVQQYAQGALAYSQFIGPLDGGQGGSVPGWLINPALTPPNSYNQNSAHVITHNAANANIHKAAAAKLPTGGGVGGYLMYLGGHEYNNTNELEQINGRRMVLNSLFIPPDRPQECGLTINATLIVRKRVINDDGGTAGVDDFNISTSAGTLVWDTGVDEGGGSTLYTAESLSVLADPNNGYTLIEDNLQDYAEGTWTCEGGDNLGGGAFDNGSVLLAPGDTKTCTITNNDIASNPDIEIDKEGSLNLGGDSIATPGDVITYTFDVTNTGDATLYNVLVSDPLPGLSAIDCSPESNPIASLASGATVQCTATYSITQDDIDAGLRDNTASVEAYCEEPEVPEGTSQPCATDEDPNEETIPQAPAVDIDKQGSLDLGWNDLADVGDIISYTFDVTNTGNITLYNVLVSDPLPGLSAISCPGGNPIPSLAPGASVQCTATYPITQEDIDAGERENTATVTADCVAPEVGAGNGPAPLPCVSDEDTNTEDIPVPGIEIDKSGSLDQGANGVTNVGDIINYTFDVTNTGNATLYNVLVTDPLPGLSAISCPGGNPIPSLAVGASVQCTATYEITQEDIDAGTRENLATVTADCVEDEIINGEEQSCVSDDDPHDVEIPPPPQRATFRVTKDFTDDNPMGVEVRISCNTGLPLDQTKVISEGEFVEFVVVEFDPSEMDCDVDEVVPDGYSPSYTAGTEVDGEAGEVGDNESGCFYEDVVGGGFTCHIVNTPDPVDIEITKEWVFENSGIKYGVSTYYELTLYCDTEILWGSENCPSVNVTEAPVGGWSELWCKQFSGTGPDVFEAQAIPDYPTSACWVVENVFDDAVEVDNGCESLTISAGNGASCTIVNTVFFEGIPTLGQYGKMLLALLMLGMGFVAYRRFT